MTWILRLILRRFLVADLKPEEQAFVADNIRKHALVLWINVAGAVLIYLGLRDAAPDVIATVITSLIAPVMVLGGAWFAISFGGVPGHLIAIAMSITLWMFLSFLLSLTAMFLSVGFVTSPYLWPVLALIYIGTIVGCIQYDTADGLKAGLDEMVLRHSRAALRYYEQQGVKPE